jgi:myo-inositol-1(or 4)-monophosphatase
MAGVRDRIRDLARIEQGLALAASIMARYQSGSTPTKYKPNRDPVTAADHEVDRALRELLTSEGEGWLSEETADQTIRLADRRIWVVDPLDGTREFVEGLPEWCVSIGLVEDGEAVAGGICNPAAGFLALGADGLGCTLNGLPVSFQPVEAITNCLVLASRTEVREGHWDYLRNAPFSVAPMGSVAYKLARVACGLAEATWTLVPKHEWDVAGGVALMHASGGWTQTLEGRRPRFNLRLPRMGGIYAVGPGLPPAVRRRLLAYANTSAPQGPAVGKPEAEAQWN